MNTRSKGSIAPALACAAVAIGIALPCAPAFADQHAGRPSGPHWRGDITRFHEHDWGVWRGGHWAHQRHDGRLGWWWVAGDTWYFYPSPVYPYPSPWEPPPTLLVAPPSAVLPPPPTPYWYLCEASNAYYPYVATCPGGWKQVPAVPTVPSTAPSK